MVSKTEITTSYLSTKQKIANPFINIAGNFRFLDAYSILRKHFGTQIVILTYHRVGLNNDKWLYPPTNPSDFEKQMKYLKKTYKIIHLDKLAETLQEGNSFKENIAVVTFDDGYKDSFLYAFPILKKYNIPATIFLITGHIDNGDLFWFDKIKYILWNAKIKKLKIEGFGEYLLDSIENKSNSIFIILEKLKKLSNEKKNNILKEIASICDIDVSSDLGKDFILSWDEVKEMNEYNINFGSHTVTHPILTKISLDEARYEISQSKKDLEKKLNQNINTFCYPNGTIDDFNDDIIEIVKNNGFSCAVTTISRKNYSRINLYKLGRLFDPWSYNSFKFLISGLYYDSSKIFNLQRG